MSGRAFSAGTLRKVKRGNGPERWVLTWTDSNGHRHRQALSTDRRVAEQRRVEIVRQRDMELAGLSAVEGMNMPLAELCDAYRADLSVRVGATQLRSVTSSLARMLAWLPAQRVRDLRAMDVLRFRAERVRNGASNRTANVDVAALTAMLRWAVSINLIAESPLRSIRRLPTTEAHQRCRRRALSDAEIDALLRAAEEDDAETAAYKAATRTISAKGREYAKRYGRAPRVLQAPLWRFLVESGCRWGETIRATWNDLDVGQRSITLRAETTKSGRTRVVPLRQALVDELLALREVHQRARRRVVQPGDRIFLSPEAADWKTYTTNCRRVFRRILDRAGIARVDSAGRRIDVHALRGSAASRMARHGVPLSVTQRVLGHSSPDITMRHYVRTEIEDLRCAAELPQTKARRAPPSELEQSA